MDDISALLNYGAALVRLKKRSKKPAEKRWYDFVSVYEEEISSWITNGNNVGIYLGYANLIDIEYDNQDGKKQLENAGLLDIITPTWSSSRGEHRLFRLEKIPKYLPKYIKLNNRGGEIRIGNGHTLSVIPPSVHENGTEYKWIISPQQCEPSLLKLADIDLFFNLK